MKYVTVCRAEKHQLKKSMRDRNSKVLDNVQELEIGEI